MTVTRELEGIYHSIATHCSWCAKYGNQAVERYNGRFVHTDGQFGPYICEAEEWHRRRVEIAREIECKGERT